MILRLVRDNYTSKCTQGRLYADGVDLKIFTLEDVVRPVKIAGETAIPEGVYHIRYEQSGHFKRLMPFLQDVPNFKYVMIHWGNSDRDTEGCILVGFVRGLDWLGDSKNAFNRLNEMIEAAIARGDEVTIEIVSETAGRGVSNA